MTRLLAATLLALLGVANPAHAMLPPQGVAFQQLIVSVGADPCVKIDIKGSGMDATLLVKVCNPAQAQALASLLNPKIQDWGVRLQVLDPQGKALEPKALQDLNEVAKVAQVAFQGNPLYTKAYPFDPMGMKPIYTLLEFKPEVVEAAIDDISNPYSTRAYVAAEVFAIFLNPDVGGKKSGLGVTTGPKQARPSPRSDEADL